LTDRPPRLPNPVEARCRRGPHACAGRRAPAWLALLAGLSTVLAAGPAAAADAPPSAREIEQQYRRGEAALASQRLALALAQRPADPGLRFLKGVMLTEAGQAAEAMALFEAMTQEFPDLPEPYNNLAVLHAGAGRLDRARELLEAALRLDPGYHAANENLGDVFVRLAQRAYQAAAAGPLAEATLRQKLRLASELAAVR